MADVGKQDFLKNAQRLVYRDDPPNAAGEFRRVSLYRTDMKYPLVRVEETLGPGPNGNDVVLSQNAEVADHVLVKVQPGVTLSQVSQLANQNGATVLKAMHSPGIYLVQLPNANLDSLPVALQAFGQSTKVLRYAEADSMVHAELVPNNPDFSSEWGMNNTGQTSGKPHADISAEAAWNIIHTSPNVVVAVLDTGIDFNHPDLQANIWTNPNPGSVSGYVNDLHGWNFYADTNLPQDDHFHGTHVAGTIGAAGNSGIGVAGVTWQVKIMPLKFLSSNGSGYTSDAIDAINYATAMHAQIMSNSWGGGAFSQALKDAIDAANTAGILFVVAAGNDGLDTDTNPTYPACFTSPNILTVAATDDNDNLASFSNYGTGTVDVAAPGVGILSTFPTTQTAAMISEGLPASYGQISGTSMATPYVSGAAALALAENPSLSVSQLKSLLTQRSDQLPNLAGVIQSSGRLNLYNVVNPNWQPVTAALQMSSIAFSDIEGNNDGQPNPGEIIHLTPTLLNVGGVSASGVSVKIVSSQATATVLNGPISIGSLAPYQPTALSTPFRIQLSGTLTDNTVLTFDVVISASGLPDVHTPATLVVSAPKGFSESTVNFACGEIKADPVRDLVYVTDITNDRILAIDTDLDQVAASSPLDTTPGPNPPASGVKNQIGQMAVSLDGTKLYVALTTQQEIQVFSLPSLVPLTTLTVNFSPVSLATGVSGRLFASSTDGWGNLREVNPNSGAAVTTFNKGANGSFYQGALLRSNLAGTKLYAAETGLSGAVETIYQYDISSGGESLQNTYSCPMANLEDFGVDEVENRIYSMNGGVYGVGVTDMVAGTYNTVWPFGSSYGAAVTFLPNDSVIYGASGDPYNGNIRKFNRIDGSALGDYVVAKNGSPISPRGIAITPNGKIFYVRTNSGAGSTLGLIGATSLTITNPPPPPPTPAAIVLASVAFSDTEGNGDGVANPGEVINLTPTFKNTGGTMGTNVSVSLSPGTGATLLTPISGSQTIGTVTAGASVSSSVPYRLQLGSGLTDGTSVNFTFTVTWDTGQSQQFTYTQIVHTSVPVAELASSLQFGEILADQQRDDVYIIDKRFLRILVFDTDGGHVSQAVPLGGLKTVNGVPPAPGMMAESVDGTRLFVALPASQIIQEFSLPDMTSLAQWSYSFQPESLATDAQGRIYCTTNDATQKLVQVDGTSGAVLTQSGPAFAGGILHRNAAGTELDGSLNGQIYRFATSGSGAPTQIAALTAGSGTIVDFAVDEQATLFYSILDDGNVTLVPFSGAAVSKWALNQTWGSAVSYLPGSNFVLGGSDFWYGGGIRKYLRSNGSTIQDYAVNNSANSIAPRGIATTPNGRTVYIRKYWSGSANDPSVDGYDYTVGMIGGAVNLDIPTGTAIGLLSVAVTDPAPGSNDGYVHPGQTVQISPVLKNFTTSLINNVSITLMSSDSLGVVASPATSTIGNVASYVNFSPSSNFKVAIGSGAPDGRQINLTFQVNYNNGTQQIIPYSLYVDAPVNAQAPVNFAIGAMLSDRTRDLAYVIDNTNNRLLAIDTDAGVVSKSVNLEASPGIGQMTLSADGSQLFVALTNAKQIQIFHLPDLTQSDIINVNFQPVSLAALSDGKLYASSAASSDYLYQIDPVTRLSLGSFGRRTYYSGPVIRTNGSQSSLFVVELGLSGNDSVDQYTVASSGPPTFTHAYPFLLDNTYDIAIDDTYNRIYSANGGGYGIVVTDMTTGTGGVLWPYDQAYSSALCFLPQSNFVYGAAPDNLIRRFNRADGTPLADFPVVTGNWTIMDRGMVITANGHILYAESQFTGSSTIGINSYLYQLGLIGHSSLTIAPPTAAPAIYTGTDLTIHLSQAATLSATVTSSTSNVPVSWSVPNGAGNAVVNTASSTTSTVSFSAPGVYQVQGTANQGSLTGSDLINVTVLPDPAAVSVTATSPTASNGGSNGQLTFTRTGTPTGNLAVSYLVTGTAVSGTDYPTLSGTATIPDGDSSVVVPVIANPGATPNATIIATVAASANYDLGVFQQATITIGAPAISFQNWVASALTGYTLAQQTSTANPSGDGISNLMKYALNLDPKQRDTTEAGLPIAAISQPIGGQTYLTLTYKQLIGANDIHYVVQVSSDLVNWTSDSTQVGSPAPNGDGTQTIVMRDMLPMGSSNRRFIRLQITQP